MSKALVAECDWSTWYLENGGEGFCLIVPVCDMGVTRASSFPV